MVAVEPIGRPEHDCLDPRRTAPRPPHHLPSRYRLAEPLSQLLGWPLPSAHLTAAGIFLLFWAACNYAIGKIARPALALVWLNIAGDCSWVLVSIVLASVHASTLTPLGMALLLGQAAGVGLVIATKLAGVARLTHPLSA